MNYYLLKYEYQGRKLRKIRVTQPVRLNRGIFIYFLLWISIAGNSVRPLISQEMGPPAAPEVSTGPNKIQNADFFIQKAIENNPVYKAMLHDSAGMRKMYESETMFMENPMFSVGLLNVPLNSFPSLSEDTMSGFGFMLSQTFALPGESESRKKIAFKEFESRQQEAENMRLMLVNQTESLYHDIVFLYRKKALMSENRKTLANIVTIARSLVSVNKMNSSHLLKLEANLSQIESEILEVSALIARSESVMESLTTVKPDESLMAITAPENEEFSISEIYNKTNHPLLKQAEAMVGRAMANKVHEEAKYFPSLTLSAEYMLRESVSGQSMSGEDMISLRLTAPLPLFFAIKESRSVLAAEAGVKQAVQKLENARLVLKTSWEGERQMASRLAEVYSRYHNEVLPRFFASYKAQLSSLSSGSVSLLDVLDSYREYLEISIKEAETYRDLKKSMAMLKYYGGDK